MGDGEKGERWKEVEWESRSGATKTPTHLPTYARALIRHKGSSRGGEHMKESDITPSPFQSVQKAEGVNMQRSLRFKAQKTSLRGTHTSALLLKKNFTHTFTQDTC